MKNWLVIIIISLVACTKEEGEENIAAPQKPPPVECKINIKACTVHPDDTVYLKWTDQNHTLHDYYIGSCLYIQTTYFTEDTIFLEYHAIQNHMQIQISVSQSMMLDTLFQQAEQGSLDFIVKEPE